MSRRLVCAALIMGITALASPGQAAGEERTLTILEPERSARLDPAFEMIMQKIDNDLGYILSAPFRSTPKGTALAGMTVITTLFLIDTDQDYLLDVAETEGDRSDYAYGRLRVVSRHVPEITAGLYLLGYFTDDEDLKSRALEGFEAVAITALITASSAFLIGHAAPTEDLGADEFEPFSDYRSMPDMNSALAFSVAGVMAYDRGWLEQCFYYTVAAGVGMSRIYHQEAWPSDVFLGSVLGAVIGRTVAVLSAEGGDTRLGLEPLVIVDGRAMPGIRLNWEL